MMKRTRIISPVETTSTPARSWSSRGHLGGVLHQLAHVEGAQTARLHGFASQPDPAGQAVAAHHRGGQDARGGDGRAHEDSGRDARSWRNAAIAALCSGESSMGSKVAFMRSRNGVAVEIEGEAGEPLAGAHAGGGEREQALHHRLHRLRKLCRRHHPIHDVQALGLAGTDVLAQQDQLARARQPHETRQSMEGERGDQPFLHRGQADQRRIAGQAVVTDQRELQPPAERVPVDGGQEQRVHVLDGHHRVFPRAEVGEAELAARQRAQVHAGAEGAPGARDDGHPYTPRVTDARDRLGEIAHPFAVPRIEDVGAVEGQSRHLARDLEPHRAHAAGILALGETPRAFHVGRRAASGGRPGGN
jgi:hypothetical protein